MSEMVERIARLIGAAVFRPQPHMSGDIWQRLGVQRRACEDAARAAIEAMREPADAMTEHPSYINGEWSRRNIEAFIDAALTSNSSLPDKQPEG